MEKTKSPGGYICFLEPSNYYLFYSWHVPLVFVGFPRLFWYTQIVLCIALKGCDCVYVNSLVRASPCTVFLWLCIALFAMTHWKVEDFLVELDNFAEIQKRKPDSQLISGLWKVFARSSSCSKNVESHWHLAALGQGGRTPTSWTMVPFDESNHWRLVCARNFPHEDHSRSSNSGSLDALLVDPRLGEDSPFQDCGRLYVCFGCSPQENMGVVHMREDTKKQCMAIVMWWMGDNVPDAWPLYYLCQDFSRLFGADGTQCLAESLAKYPCSPTTLSKGWLQKVYGSDEAPAGKELNLGAFLESHSFAHYVFLVECKALW